MRKLLITAAALGGLAAFSVYNYRRFVPKTQSFADKKYEIEVKPIQVQSGEHTLYGEMLRPKGVSGPLPTVVCCHGLGGSYKLCKDTMGSCFAKSGLQVYCFDFYGGSKKSRSGGTMREMSIFTEREDLRFVIEKMKTLECVDQSNLFLLGESQGGCVAGMTAPEYVDDLKGMIQYYPAFCIPDDARKRFASVEDIPEVGGAFSKDVGRIYNEKLLDYDVYSDIVPFDKPVLIIHGDQDPVVNISYGKRAAETYPNAVFHSMPGENHGFSGKGKLEAARLSYEFIQKLIKE